MRPKINRFDYKREDLLQQFAGKTTSEHHRQDHLYSEMERCYKLTHFFLQLEKLWSLHNAKHVTACIMMTVSKNIIVSRKVNVLVALIFMKKETDPTQGRSVKKKYVTRRVMWSDNRAERLCFFF